MPQSKKVMGLLLAAALAVGCVTWLRETGPRQSTTTPSSSSLTMEGIASASSTIEAKAATSTGERFCASGTDDLNLGDPAQWPTYINSGDGYSIRYPNLGKLSVEYPLVDKRTILGWENVGCFHLEIFFIGATGLSLQPWLSQHAPPGPDAQAVTIDGMQGVIEFDAAAGNTQVYLERDINGFPLIYDIDFEGYFSPPPPFWRSMLESFEMLPSSE